MASVAGAVRLVGAVLERRRAAVVGALVVSAALSMFVTARDDQPKESRTAVRLADGMFVMDDFESGALTGWRAVGDGAGGWFTSVWW